MPLTSILKHHRTENTMNIAILGTGNMAQGLASNLAKAGYAVILGSRDAAKAKDVAKTIGGKVSADSVKAAAAKSDVVILAVPYAAVAATIAEAGGLAGKTVIDITNPLTADYSGLTIGHTTSAAEEIQKLAPNAKVVKAFNTIFASVLQADGKAAGTPATVFIAGDDAEANKAVGDLAAKIGFVPLQTGKLAAARYLEPVAGLNIALGYGLGHGTDIAPAWQRAA
jgi:8-hydroxy-5-deazaflavin:NADPH oxidoreductase